MAFQVVLFTALVAAASAGNLGLGYAGTYGHGLGYTGYSARSLAYSAPIVNNVVEKTHVAYTAPQEHHSYTPGAAYTVPVSKTIRHEPDVLEYSTLVKTAPAIHKTRIAHPPPVVHESYSAPIVHKTYEQAPIVHKIVESVPVVHKTIAAPVVAPYLPAPVVHKTYDAPIVPSYGPALNYGAPGLNYGAPGLNYGAPALNYGAPAW